MLSIYNARARVTRRVRHRSNLFEFSRLFYRGRPVRLYLQLFTEAFAPVGTKVHRWTGTMEPVRITRRTQAGGPSSGRIEMPCTRNGMARARNYQGLRLTHAQQQVTYPADLGLEYLQALIEKPALWLSKRFQEI